MSYGCAHLTTQVQVLILKGMHEHKKLSMLHKSTGQKSSSMFGHQWIEFRCHLLEHL